MLYKQKPLIFLLKNNYSKAENFIYINIRNLALFIILRVHYLIVKSILYKLKEKPFFSLVSST